MPLEFPDLVRREDGLAGALLDGDWPRDSETWRRQTDAAPGICRPDGSRHSASAATRPCPRRIRDCRRRRSRAPSSTATRWWARRETSPTETGWRRSGRRRRRRWCCCWPSRSCWTNVAMCLDAAGRHHDLFGLVGGIGDPDAARRRPQIAVQIVDGENSQIDRCGLRVGGARASRRQQRGDETDASDVSWRFKPSWPGAADDPRRRLQLTDARHQRRACDARELLDGCMRVY